MNADAEPDPDRSRLIDESFAEAMDDVSWRARRHGTTIVTSEGGRVVELTPDEFDARRAAKTPASPGRQPGDGSAAE